MEQYRISIYNEQSHQGLVRHLFLRWGEQTREAMVCLVINGTELPHADILVARLTKAFPQIVSIQINCNTAKTNVILGPVCRVLYGKPVISDILCGIKVELSPLSFYQVNRSGAEKLYGIAADFAGLTGGELLLDLYCGAGTIGLSMARRVREVIGVEIVKEAVENARENARRNGIHNARFLCDDAAGAAQTLAEEGLHPDVVVLDPPRKGCDAALLKTVGQMTPDRIVMISCNSATAARDAAILCQNGYRVTKLQAVDMFPRTAHVETVVLLSKGEIDSKKVRVEFSLEDMDMSGFQKGATYEQIKAYVLEKFELKVSSLYISQIKRKCGLDVGQNYNLSKKENAKVPKCPPEKEAAIMDALKYFQMIM